MRLAIISLAIAIVALLFIGGLAIVSLGNAAKRAQIQQAQTSADYAALVQGYQELAMAAIKPRVPWWAGVLVVVGLSIAGFLAWREIQFIQERQAYLEFQMELARLALAEGRHYFPLVSTRDEHYVEIGREK